MRGVLWGLRWHRRSLRIAYNKDGHWFCALNGCHDPRPGDCHSPRGTNGDGGKVTAITGEEVEIQADSICVHGDNPEAIVFVARIRRRWLKQA